MHIEPYNKYIIPNFHLIVKENKKNNIPWDDMYNYAKKFYEQNGHLDVAYDFKFNDDTNESNNFSHTATTELVELSVYVMRILAIGYIAVAVTQSLSGVMRGAGDTVRSIIISANSRLAYLENKQVLRLYFVLY